MKQAWLTFGNFGFKPVASRKQAASSHVPAVTIILHAILGWRSHGKDDRSSIGKDLNMQHTVQPFSRIFRCSLKRSSSCKWHSLAPFVRMQAMKLTDQCENEPFQHHCHHRKPLPSLHQAHLSTSILLRSSMIPIHRQFAVSLSRTIRFIVPRASTQTPTMLARRLHIPIRLPLTIRPRKAPDLRLRLMHRVLARSRHGRSMGMRRRFMCMRRLVGRPRAHVVERGRRARGARY